MGTHTLMLPPVLSTDLIASHPSNIPKPYVMDYSIQEVGHFICILYFVFVASLVSECPSLPVLAPLVEMHALKVY